MKRQFLCLTVLLLLCLSSPLGATVYQTREKAIYWDGRNNVGERVSSGIYFYQLQADNVSFLCKMVILK